MVTTYHCNCSEKTMVGNKTTKIKDFTLEPILFPDRGRPHIILLIIFPDRDRKKPSDR